MKLPLKGTSLLLLALIVSASAQATPKKYKTSKIPHHETVKEHVDYKAEVIPVPCEERGHFELLGGGGIANLRAHDFTELGISESESDTLVQTNKNSWDTGVGHLGAGYVYYLISPSSRSADDVQFLTEVKPQINYYYYSSDSIKGDVYRFNNPAFNQFTFDIPIRSSRLMLDLGVTLASWRKLSLFAIGGIGEGWTRVGYSDTANSGLPCNLSDLNLSKRYQNHFAYELGTGLQYDFTHKIGLSLEYLYAWWGKLETPSTVNGNDVMPSIVEPASFKLKSQAVLLDLHVAIT